MMKHLISTLFILICTYICSHSQRLSKKEWLEDLSVLENAVYQKHIQPFWKHPKTEFVTLFDSLRKSINNANQETLIPEKITTGFAQILALTADGHSGVSTKSRAELFGLYKYNVAWFPEGLFLTRVEHDKKEFLGSRILKIDDTPLDEAKKLVANVSTSFHEQGFKRFSPRYLESPGVLYGLGIAKSPKTVSLTVQKLDGQTTTLHFERASAKEVQRAKFLTLSDITTIPLPISRQPRNQNYWFEYLPQNKLLYLQYSVTQNSKEDPMEAFIQRLAEAVNNADVDKFVIDLRYNGGGDQFTTWPLLMYVMNNEKVNQAGKFFVITSHNTFSAATAFAQALDAKTHAILVGSASADSPVYPSEDNDIVLPNCKMEVRLSSEILNRSFNGDNRIDIQPELQVVTGVNDFIAGKDPILDLIISYKPVQSSIPIVNNANLAGRYFFGLDNTLQILNNNGNLRARVNGRLNTPLIPLSANRFATGVKGFEFEFKNNTWELHYPDGHYQVLIKMKDKESSAVDLILNKQYEQASKVYADLKKNNPDDINLNGTTLASLAYYLLMETMDVEGGIALVDIAIQLDNNSEVARGLLKGLKAFTK